MTCTISPTASCVRSAAPLASRAATPLQLNCASDISRPPRLDCGFSPYCEYALGPKPYEVDQAHRDILLAHARKDAAEALATSRTVLRAVRKLTSTLDQISRVAFWLFVAYLLWSWWKSDFAVWWQ